MARNRYAKSHLYSAGQLPNGQSLLPKQGAVHQTTTSVAVGFALFGPPRRQNQWYQVWRDVIPRIGVTFDLAAAIHTLSQDDETSGATMAC
jgi:hypothetical protein